MLKKVKTILLYGGSGLVGSRINEMLGEEFKIVAPLHKDVDVTDKTQVKKNIHKVKPDYIIYAAGLVKVDKAEENPKEAFLLNSEAISYICDFAKNMGVPVCYFSTDAVFDGKQNERPYTETDKPNPESIYGKSKQVGELAVLEASNSNLVLRIIMVYSSNFPKKKDFPRVVVEALKNKEKLAGITDQVVNPIYVDTVVRALKTLLAKGATGIYHLGATDYVSNFEFAQQIARTFDLDAGLIYRISFDEFFKGKLAKRGQYCWLDTSKFIKEFGRGVLHSTDEELILFKKMLKLL